MIVLHRLLDKQEIQTSKQFRLMENVTHAETNKEKGGGESNCSNKSNKPTNSQVPDIHMP